MGLSETIAKGSLIHKKNSSKNSDHTIRVKPSRSVADPVLHIAGFSLAFRINVSEQKSTAIPVVLNPATLTTHWFVKTRHEPRYDKTNKVTVRPAKTQIRPGIRPV